MCEREGGAGFQGGWGDGIINRKTQRCCGLLNASFGEADSNLSWGAGDLRGILAPARIDSGDGGESQTAAD